MMNYRGLGGVAVAALLALCASSARAAVTFDWATVGNKGNDPDTRYDATGIGSVANTYRIAKHEVTAGQYADFLNAVDPTGANSLGLYNSSMDTSEYGCQITWNQAAWQYDFSGGTVEAPGSTAADWENRPVNFVGFWDAARFVNWLHNGQGGGGTETGAYVNIGEQATFVRQPGAHYFLPSEDEWYKAAYHKNNGPTGDYFEYPTRNDSTPSNDLVEPTDPGNNATFSDGDYTIGSPYYRTEVGAHENSESSYGTFDQGGNVFEWNETAIDASSGVRGGSFGLTHGGLLASSELLNDPTLEYYYLGFRVASPPEPTGVIPEPTSIVVWALGLGLLWWRRKAKA